MNHNKNNKWFIKFGYSEKATKLEKIFHLKFDATQYLLQGLVRTLLTI